MILGTVVDSRALRPCPCGKAHDRSRPRRAQKPRERLLHHHHHRRHRLRRPQFNSTSPRNKCSSLFPNLKLLNAPAAASPTLPPPPSSLLTPPVSFSSYGSPSLPLHPLHVLRPTPAAAAAAASAAAPSHASAAGYVTNLGLGYAIAIALGFLVLLSAALLASYICCRSSRRRRLRRQLQQQQQLRRASGGGGPAPPGGAGSDGIILPRIIFVAEDDNEGSEAEQGAAVGLDPSVINSYPKFAFSREAGGVGGSTTCSICLCEYKDAEMLRMMPECRHFFHLLCLDAWLKLNGSCPVCRNSPLPTPLSTPLSEVVPLSQYGEDRRRRR